MAERVLSQAAVSFLLGIAAAWYGQLWVYGLWAVWLIGVGWMAFRAGKISGRSHGSTAESNGDIGRVSRRVSKGAVKSPRQAGMLLPVLLRLLVCLTLCILGSVRYQEQQRMITAVETCLSEESSITAAGTIRKKEEKNSQIIYYLKDSYIICDTGVQKSRQILIYPKKDMYSIGDTIIVTGTGEGFDGARNEGNFDAKSYYYSRNILCRIRADSVTLADRPALPIQEMLYQIRKKMQGVYLKYLPGDTAGVLSVMTLGEKGMLDAEVKKLYQQSGISHVLAISGLHVSILGAGVYRFLKKRGLSYLWAGILAGLLILCFGELSGMELSTGRAVLMFLVMLLGNVLGMAYDSVTALSLSALLQLWESPCALQYAGFLFSYGAVLAVVVAVKILKEVFSLSQSGDGKERKKGLRARLTSWGRNLKEVLFVSTCIQLVTLPLTVWFYCEFPLYSVLINGLLLPLMGLVLLSGILGGLAGVLSGLLFGPGEWAMQGMSFLLLRPAYFLLEWNRQICSLFGQFPGAMQITGQPEPWIMVAYYVILIMGLWCMYRWNLREMRSRKYMEAAGGGMCRMAVGKAMVLLFIMTTLLTLLFYRSDMGVEICFLDVGQGEGIYVQDGSGHSFFVDGGSTSEKKVGEYRILSFLKYRGVRRVDGWFVSHADSDHISGLLEVWESGYTIGQLFLSQWIPRDEAWEELCRKAEQYGTRIIYLKPGDVVGVKDLTFTCLYPWEEETDRNNASMALHLQSPRLTAFFGGDLSAEAEKMLAEQYDRGPVDLYKAIHHGSDGSNSDTLLACLKPAMSVVSCGEKNSYGHPGKNAVRRMESWGGRIFYTMEGGQITVGSDEQGIWVKEFVR